jgi:hypothetical protein
MTILQYNLARLNHARQVADFDQRIREEWREKRMKMADGRPRKPVRALYANGRLIREFRCVADAASVFDIHPESLRQAIKRKSVTRSGFRFEYA